MLLRRSTSTWSESLIWINPRRGYSRSMITYAVTDKTTAKATECKYIQTTPNRHVVAREQRTGESQRAEHPEDHQWRMNSSGLCSRRGDVEHRVQRGQEQHRRLGRSRFPRGGDSERPYFALQLRRPRLLRFHRLHIRHLPIDLDPRVQVTTEEIAHGWLRVRWEQSDPQPCRADVIGFLDDEMPPRIKACKRPRKTKMRGSNPTTQRSHPRSHQGPLMRSRLPP
jgi:hypothetical protein